MVIGVKLFTSPADVVGISRFVYVTRRKFSLAKELLLRSSSSGRGEKALGGCVLISFFNCLFSG